MNQKEGQQERDKSNTWLRLILLELQNVTEFREPDQEIDKSHDRVIGEMTVGMKRLWTRYQELSDRCKRLTLEFELAREKSVKENLLAQVNEAHAKVSILRKLFWIGVNDELDLWPYNSVGVRIGYKVVVSLDKESDSPTDFLRKLLGLGD